MNTYEDILADEVLAELGRHRNLTAKDLQRAAGISQSAWGNYFVQRKRDVPMKVVVAVCEAFGIQTSVIMRRVEDRLAEADKPTPEQIADQLIATLPADARRDIARVAEGLRPKPAEDDPPMAAGDR